MAYTENQLKQREKIIESQKLFWSMLDSTMVNKLVNLFDDSRESPYKISKYIEYERKLRGLDKNIDIIGKVYGENLPYY
jgi:hypothetical protein